MEIELNTVAKTQRLNACVAITVVLLSVFMAVCKIKDDNLVQAMQQAKANAVDTWSEYQSEKVKIHLAESTSQQVTMFSQAGIAKNPEVLTQASTTLSQKIIQYQAKASILQTAAKGLEKQYDDMNFHDDQFDMSDAALSIALALAAVAALTDMWALLVISWFSGSFGILFGIAGFLGWRLHPDWLAAFLS